MKSFLKTKEGLRGKREDHQKKKRTLEIEERHVAAQHKKRKATLLNRDDSGSLVDTKVKMV